MTWRKTGVSKYFPPGQIYAHRGLRGRDSWRRTWDWLRIVIGWIRSPEYCHPSIVIWVLSVLAVYLQKHAGVAGWLVNQSPWGSDSKGTFTWFGFPFILDLTLKFCPAVYVDKWNTKIKISWVRRSTTLKRACFIYLKLTKPWTDPAQSWTSESLACSTSQFWKVPTRAVLLREKYSTHNWAKGLKPNILTNKSLKGKPAVRVEVNDIGSWESPGATDEEAPTRETPPTHTKKAAPAKNIHAEVLSFCFADGISWNAKSTSSPSDTEEKGEKNAVNPSSVTLNPVALQCRISSMQPFNDTFSPLCPVISFTNPPKSWHWTDIQRMLLVNDTFTSECFLSLLNSVPCLSSLSQAESVCFFQQRFLRGFICLQSDKAFCFLPFFFSFHPCWLKICEQYLLKQPKNSRSPKVLRCRKNPCGSPSL